MWEVLHYPLTSFKCRDRPKARNTTVLIVAQFSFIHLPVECVDSRKVAPPPRTHHLFISLWNTCSWGRCHLSGINTFHREMNKRFIKF